MSKICAVRYHDISTGHRVLGHQGKCAHLHGHNYRFHFHCEAEQLDELGMVVDFSEIKTTLCQWLEDNWDHKMLIYIEDPLVDILVQNDPKGVVVVGFNPTAENLAKVMIDDIAPSILPSGIKLVTCQVDETRKCSAVAYA